MEPRIPPELHTQTATPGQVLKALREALKTGQFDFATDVNWDQSKVSRLETGKQKFIEENLEDLIRAGLIEEDGIWAKVFRAAMDRNQETSPPAPSPSRPRLKLTRPQLLAGLAVPVLLAVVVLTASRAIGSLGRVLAPSQPTKVVMGEATSTPYPTNTPYPTYTLPAKSASTSTPYPTYTPQPTYTPYPSSTPTPTVTPTPTAAVPLPFFDDFDDGLDEAWRVISGDWRMSNGWILNTEDNGQWGCITVGEKSWSDYTVEVDLYGRDGSVCVTIRENRQGQWLEFRIEPNRAGWYEVSASDIKPIVTKAGGISRFLDSPGRLLIRAEGKIFSAYLDGKLVLSVDDNNHPSGYVGLCADGPTKFNDFRVTRLE